MEIMLGENYKVYTVPRNFVLEKLEEITDRKTGETRIDWKNVGYFGRFEHLLNTYVNENIKDMGNTDLVEIKELLVALSKQIDKVVKKENIKLDDLQ